MSLSPAASLGPRVPSISTRPVFTLLADVQAPMTAYDAPWGSRRLVAVRGGSFVGESIRGRVEAGGADHQFLRPDGVLELDVRLLLTTEDAERLSMSALGLRVPPPDVDASVARGESPDHRLPYFRQLVRLETSSPRLLWMNGRLFIGAGRRLPAHVELTVYELL